MTKYTSEITEVKGLLDKRLKDLSQVKKTLTLGGSDSAFVLSDFMNKIAGFSAIINSTEKSFIKQELANIQNTKMQEIPVDEIEGNPAIAAMHSNFKNLTAAIFSSDYVPDFFRDVLAMGCQNSLNAGNSFVSDILNLKDLISTHASEIGGYLELIKNTPSKDLPKMLATQGPDIINAAQGLYLNTVKLFNNIKKTNSFSDTLINSVLSDADNLINTFTDSAGKNPAAAAANIESVLGLVDEVEYNAENLKSFANNIQSFDSEFQSLDLNKLLDGNFKNLLSSGSNVIKLAEQAISSAKSGNATGVMQAVKSITSNLAYLKGQVSLVKNNKLSNMLSSTPDLLNDFTSLKACAESFVNNFPNETMRSFMADIRAVEKITKDLLKPLEMLNSGKRPDLNNMLSVASRISSKADSIISHTSAFITGIGMFKASDNNNSKTAIAALKKAAPTPLETLAKGNVSTFKKSLDNPMLLSKIGQCQVALHESMQKPDMTTAKLSKLNALLSFVNGEKERELMTNFVSDLDLQKSIAVNGIDGYINEIILPQQRILEDFIKLTGMDA